MATHFKSRTPHRGGRQFSRYPANRSFSRGPRRSAPKARSIDVSRFINAGSQPIGEPEVFVPTHRFADFNVDQRIKANIAQKGYETPTPIQDQAIPLILE